MFTVMTLIEKAGKVLAEEALAMGFRRSDRGESMRATNELSKVSKGSFTAFYGVVDVGQYAQRRGL
jgi:hypothetical protein